MSNKQNYASETNKNTGKNSQKNGMNNNHESNKTTNSAGQNSRNCYRGSQDNRNSYGEE